MNKNFKELIIELMFFTLLLLIIIFFHKNVVLSTILSVILVSIAFIFFHSKEDKIFYLTGAVIGGIIGEMIVVSFGAWKYSTQILFNIPIWLPILWGFILVLIKRTITSFLKLEHIKNNYKHHLRISSFYRIFIQDISLFFIIIFSYAFLWKNNLYVFIILSLVFLIMISLHHTKMDLIIYFIIGILGTIADIVCSFFGAWIFMNPTLLGIPFWVPIGYGLTMVIIVRMSIAIINLVEN